MIRPFLKRAQHFRELHIICPTLITFEAPKIQLQSRQIHAREVVPPKTQWSEIISEDELCEMTSKAENRLNEAISACPDGVNAVQSAREAQQWINWSVFGAALVVMLGRILRAVSDRSSWIPTAKALAENLSMLLAAWAVGALGAARSLAGQEASLAKAVYDITALREWEAISPSILSTTLQKAVEAVLESPHLHESMGKLKAMNPPERLAIGREALLRGGWVNGVRLVRLDFLDGRTAKAHLEVEIPVDPY